MAGPVIECSNSFGPVSVCVNADGKVVIVQAGRKVILTYNQLQMIARAVK